MPRGGGLMPDGKKTEVQKLGDLVEWYLSDKEVELKFVPNEKKMGRLAPEYDFCYLVDGRRITERALAMSILTELSRMNYSVSLGKTICAMTDIAWKHYIANQEYPAWLRDDFIPVIKRPRGRPRVRPLKIPFSELDSVNTEPDEQE